MAIDLAVLLPTLTHLTSPNLTPPHPTSPHLIATFYDVNDARSLSTAASVAFSTMRVDGTNARLVQVYEHDEAGGRVCVCACVYVLTNCLGGKYANVSALHGGQNTSPAKRLISSPVMPHAPTSRAPTSPERVHLTRTHLT